MHLRVLCLILAGMLGAGSAGAAVEMSESPADPALERAQAAFERKDWAGVQAALRDTVEKGGAGAEHHNLYAYAVRQGANPDMSLVFKHYNRALSLDPGHRGAHEYLGEAYLMVGNLPKAKEHLAQLDKLCLLPCREYRQLKKAVGEYEARRAAR